MTKQMIGEDEKNRGQINWTIRNMQMNSFQFKCRFWHFSAVGRRRMSETEENMEEYLYQKLKQLFYPYLYSNQLFVYLRVSEQ